MQIGQVMGVAVLGLVFATSYGSAFDKEVSPHAKAEIPAAVYADFQDPTLPLDPKRFDAARSEILKNPDGQAILDQALFAQREAVTTAIDRIFIASLAGAVVVVALAATLKEIPLRNSFSSEGEGAPMVAEPEMV
jgi:hypothetical protein